MVEATATPSLPNRERTVAMITSGFDGIQTFAQMLSL